MKIAFLDFWQTCDIPGHGRMLGFDPNNNVFLHMLRELRENVEVVHPDNADVIFYSCFGDQQYAYSNKHVNKIFYTGENLRPNYKDCTHSLTFDFDSYDGKNIRFALWMMQIDWFKKKTYDNPHYIFPLSYVDGTNPFKQNEKSKFTSSVFNNQTENRLSVCSKLNEYKTTDVFGKNNGNWSYGEYLKLTNISNYKFNVCFENIIYPGYNTEKLIHARVAGCIPLYWGAKETNLDFNPKSYINLLDFESEEAFIEYVKEIDNNDKLYQEILSEPLFNKIPDINDIMKPLSLIL